MENQIKIKLLLLPKFEFGDITDNSVGEARYYYRAYLEGGSVYEIKGGFQGSKLYVKDGVALYITGMGKVNAAVSLFAVLSDTRFDFSEAYFISIGCGGTAAGFGVMGDVFIISACVDFDLGHRVDSSELTSPSDTTWFPDEIFESSSCKKLDPALVDAIFDLTKDIKLESTPKTLAFMAETFQNAPWATRMPRVLRGTTVSGDNYWKGLHGHRNAKLITETYRCPDPYAMTEMEDVALAVVLDRLHLLNRYIVIRDAVNMDVFMNGITPEQLWKTEAGVSITSEESAESLDIFDTAMKNSLAVGTAVINAILNKEGYFAK